MITIDIAPQSARVSILQAGLRQLRAEANRIIAADTVHRIQNSIMTAQGALHIAEGRLIQERTDDLDNLLDLAEARLKEGRKLVVRSQQVRFPTYRVARLATA